ncbi:MAG: RNA-binding cell elongation regulator Jag/EloR [Acidimicrobiia bacterium]
MSSVEWVEVRGKDVDIAVSAAVEELGLEGPDAADVEILQQPERGFLGMGGRDAIVRVKPKQQKAARRRRRGGRGRGNGRGSGARDAERTGDGGVEKARKAKPKQQSRPPRQRREKSEKREQKVEVEADRTEQAEMVRDFLTGLLDAFGLEGEVTCTVEDDIILADVAGEQTEALVGNKGAILQAILELSRTIVQRKSQAGARIRLDIAGYTARRREALRIYTGRLVEKVLEKGGEIMLEPMNAADRKVVHDAAADLGGVRTFSEGEEPRRSVVIARDDD